MNCKKCAKVKTCPKSKNPENYAIPLCRDYENRFDKSLKRITKILVPQDNWSEDDMEHYKTIIKALEIASELCEKGGVQE